MYNKDGDRPTTPFAIRDDGVVRAQLEGVDAHACLFFFFEMQNV